jgi:hypothetical protein
MSVHQHEHERKRDPEKFTRESFSMRRPSSWQTAAMGVVAIAVVVALLAYALI